MRLVFRRSFWSSSLLPHQQLWAEGRALEGLKSLQNLIVASPSDLGLRRELLDMLVGLGRFAEGVQVANDVLEAQKEELQKNLSIAAHASAATGVSETENPSTHRANTFYQRGECFERLGQMERAVSDYRSCLHLAPNHIWALQRLGNLLGAQNDESFLLLSSAVDACENDDGDAEQRADLLHDRARLFLARKMLDEALRDFDASVAANDKCAPSYLGRGDVFFMKDDMLKALNNYQRFVDLHTAYFTQRTNFDKCFGDELVLEVLVKQCACYANIRDFDSVIECAEAVISCWKDEEKAHSSVMSRLVGMAHYFRGRAFEEGNNDFDEALQCYNEAVKINASLMSVYVKRAQLLRKMGREDEAIKDEQKITKRKD